jgi:Solute carrier family 35
MVPIQAVKTILEYIMVTTNVRHVSLLLYYNCRYYVNISITEVVPIYYYILISIIDVVSNILASCSFHYTSLTSTTLLGSLSIPTNMFFARLLMKKNNSHPSSSSVSYDASPSIGLDTNSKPLALTTQHVYLVDIQLVETKIKGARLYHHFRLQYNTVFKTVM